MLCNLDVHDTFLAHGLLDRGEEIGLFIVMTLCHRCMPCEATANEVFLVGKTDHGASWSVLVQHKGLW